MPHKYSVYTYDNLPWVVIPLLLQGVVDDDFTGIGCGGNQGSSVVLLRAAYLELLGMWVGVADEDARLGHRLIEELLELVAGVL